MAIPKKPFVASTRVQENICLSRRNWILRVSRNTLFRRCFMRWQSRRTADLRQSWRVGVSRQTAFPIGPLRRKTLRIIDLATQKTVHLFSMGEGWPTNLAFADNGTTLAYVFGGGIECLDVVRDEKKRLANNFRPWSGNFASLRTRDWLRNSTTIRCAPGISPLAREARRRPFGRSTSCRAALVRWPLPWSTLPSGSSNVRPAATIPRSRAIVRRLRSNIP